MTSPGTGSDLGNVRPFRMSSNEEVVKQLAVILALSGLREDQVARNPWGFPFMPIPSSRSIDPARPVLMPSNVTPRFAGHPLYWIDPYLTRMSEDEARDPAIWCVRMTYLLLGFGLLDVKTFRFYDVFKKDGVVIETDDLSNYIAGYKSVINPRIYQESDLLIPKADIEAAVVQAVTTCRDMNVTLWKNLRTKQKEAHTSAREILDPHSNPYTEIERILAQAVEGVADALADGSRTTPHIAEISKAIEQFKDLIASFDEKTVLLNTLVLDSVARTKNFGLITTVDASARTVNLADIGERLDDSLARTIRLRAHSEPEEKIIAYSTVTEIYRVMVNRLELAVRNFERTLNRQRPFASVEEMQLHTPSLSDIDEQFGL